MVNQHRITAKDYDVSSSMLDHWIKNQKTGFFKTKLIA